MTEFENLLQIIKDDESLFSMKNEAIHQILNQLVEFRTKYRGKNVKLEKYFESFKLESEFTKFLENKVTLPNIEYSWLFNESGSGSSEYGYMISFLQKKYNLIISRIWDTKKAILSFSEYDGENEKFEFEIEEGENIELPKEVFDLYTCSGLERREIIVNLMVYIGIISGAICTLY
jgi:hypothetical protein